MLSTALIDLFDAQMKVESARREIGHINGFSAIDLDLIEVRSRILVLRNTIKGIRSRENQARDS